MKKFNEPIYMNKTDVFYRISSNENLDEIWEKIIKYRKENSIKIELKNQKKNNFFVYLSDELKKQIVKIDELNKKNIFEDLKEEIKYELIKNAKEEESFYSSAIEGAHTTIEKTKELIENRAKVVNTDEQMVLNNYKALEFIIENLDREIDEEIIINIHKIVTKNTLSPDEKTIKYRTNQNYVRSIEKIIYIPPKFEEVENLMNDLIEFINFDTTIYLHPLLKAAIIHFYFVYVHPFFDGNGRTARALTYMYLLKNGYDIFKYISISNMIKNFRNKYYKAIKEVEDNENDMTYFCIFHTEMLLKNIKEAIIKMNKEYKKKIIEENIKNKGLELNKRQLKLIEKTIKYSKEIIDIEYYKKINKVSQETARRDMEELVEMELFIKEKNGNKNIYKLLERI